MQKLFNTAAILSVALLWFPAQQALSATTGLDFAGGCPEGSDALVSPDPLIGSTCNGTGLLGLIGVVRKKVRV